MDRDYAGWWATLSEAQREAEIHRQYALYLAEREKNNEPR